MARFGNAHLICFLLYSFWGTAIAAQQSQQALGNESDVTIVEAEQGFPDVGEQIEFGGSGDTPPWYIANVNGDLVVFRKAVCLGGESNADCLERTLTPQPVLTIRQNDNALVLSPSGIQFSDGTFQTTTLREGPIGPEGPMGPRGFQGERGEAGPRGEPGPSGAAAKTFCIWSPQQTGSCGFGSVTLSCVNNGGVTSESGFCGAPSGGSACVCRSR